MAIGTVLRLVIRDRGGCQHVLKCSSSTFQQPPPPWQWWFHLAYEARYEAGRSATYDVRALASGRSSRMVVSSAAGLIITVTDGAGEVIEREAGCATGLGPVAHDGGRSFCATATSAGLDGADLIRRC